MKLYTINATPVRKYNQLTSNEKEAVRGGLSLEVINKDAIAEYPERVARILETSDIEGFTIYQVQGYWKGEPEVSFKIEMALEDKSLVERVAKKLKEVYNQESVMITLPDNSVKFI